MQLILPCVPLKTKNDLPDTKENNNKFKLKTKDREMWNGFTTVVIDTT